jgi:UDP-glucose 4-epimerase
VLAAHQATPPPFRAYNVATGDYVTVAEIAEIAIECVGLRKSDVRFDFTGGDRGWKGDVPIVRLDTRRIQSIGWHCRLSTREALRQSILAMIPDLRQGRM